MKAVFLSVLFMGIASGPIVQEIRSTQAFEAAPVQVAPAQRQKCMREIFHKVYADRLRKMEERRALKRKGLVSFVKVCIEECLERRAAR